MNDKLRVGDTLGEVFRIYFDRAGVLLPVAFWLFLISEIVEDTAGKSLVLFPLAIVVGLVVPTLYEGIVIGLVRDVRGARPVSSIRELISFAVPALLPLIGASFLFIIGVAVGLVLLVVPGLYLITIWAVITPLILIERSGVFAAFGRSRQLVRGSAWAVFGVSIVALVLPVGVAFGLNYAAKGVFDGAILRAILSVLIATVTAPMPSLAAGVLYYRLLALQRPVPLDNPPPPA